MGNGTVKDESSSMLAKEIPAIPICSNFLTLLDLKIITTTHFLLLLVAEGF